LVQNESEWEFSRKENSNIKSNKTIRLSAGAFILLYSSILKGVSTVDIRLPGNATVFFRNFHPSFLLDTPKGRLMPPPTGSVFVGPLEAHNKDETEQGGIEIHAIIKVQGVNRKPTASFRGDYDLV
jgi:hypothetical protein